MCFSSRVMEVEWKRMRRTFFYSKYLVALLLVMLIFPNIANAASSSPAVSFTVAPSQSVIVKPSGSSAQGSLDIRLSPEGKATNANRSPIDVAFIFDKSGSMDELGDNPAKFLSAKNAMTEAVNYFSADPNKNDRFAFIPFSSDVETDKIVGFPIVSLPTTDTVKANLQTIKTRAQGLSAVGGTNYTQSFQTANSMLTSAGGNVNKYIFFLTDGQPTSSQAVESFEDTVRTCSWLIFNCTTEKQTVNDTVTYTIYSNNTAKAVRSNGTVTSTKLSTVQAAIKSHVQTEVTNLANNNIKLYSIGFGTNSEVDMPYLQKLSETTGVTAQQASTNTIAKIFEDISQKIATPTITATVKINISKFGDKVKLADGANATVDSSGNIVIKKDILFPINQEINSPIDVSLPLTFSSTGTYSFDNITLQYRDLEGVLREKTTSTTITVKDDAPAGFNSTMTLEKEVNELNNLIKTSNSTDKTNYFNVNYSLNPTNLVNSTVSGKLANLVIKQPIPNGVSLVSTTNATEQVIDGQRYAIISLPNKETSYAKGSFSPTEITSSVQFKVDYAVYNLTMPKASLTYTDSRFTGSNITSIPASTQSINMKVQLKEQTANKYEGDAVGIIEKKEISTNTKLAQTEVPNDYNLPNKAIKDMIFKSGSNNKTIEITYADDSKAYLYMSPDYDLIGQDTGKKYASGNTSEESIDGTISQKVAGSNVAYYYQINNSGQSTGWKAWDLNDVIPITSAGLNEVKVKAVGGFANGEEISKNITISRIIKSISVQPNPIELIVGKTGNFTLTIGPDSATNKDLDIKIANPSIASLIPGQQTVLGNQAGTTELIVQSKDGSNIEVRVPIKVVDPYIALEEIKFEKPVYKVEISKDNNNLVPVEDLLIFNPSNATNKELESVVSSMPAKVEVVKIVDDFYIKGVEIGYSTVTATAEEQKNGKKPKDSALFEVVKDNGTSDEDNEDTGEGRW